MRTTDSLSTFVSDLISLSREYGLTSLAAYKAYGDPNMLAMSQAAWEYGMNYTISAQNAAAGSILTKNFTLSNVCQGREHQHPVYRSFIDHTCLVTMSGGTFWVRSFDNSIPSLRLFLGGEPR